MIILGMIFTELAPLEKKTGEGRGQERGGEGGEERRGEERR